MSSVESVKMQSLKVKKRSSVKYAHEWRLKIVKKQTKMMLTCEVKFLNCDKCEVKYPWYERFIMNPVFVTMKLLEV